MPLRSAMNSARKADGELQDRRHTYLGRVPRNARILNIEGFRHVALALSPKALRAERMASYRTGSAPGAAEAEEYASSTMLDAAAGSVAARGLLFTNCRQAPRRFYAMRGPALFTVQKARDRNRAAISLVLARTHAQGGCIGCGLTDDIFLNLRF